MKIGLIRHFEVTRGMPGKEWITSQQLQQWLKEYDLSAIKEKEVDLCSIEWKQCYSSDSSRALKTAERLFKGKIIVTSTLREPEIRPFNTGNLRLPIFAWRLLLRMAWLTSHKSQSECKNQFFGNVRTFMDNILPQSCSDTLIVSHAGIMMFLRKELIRQGYKGPDFRLADHGKLYLFEKSS